MYFYTRIIFTMFCFPSSLRLNRNPVQSSRDNSKYAERACRVLVMVFLAVFVLAGSAVSKGTLLLATSQISPDTSLLCSNQPTVPKSCVREPLYGHPEQSTSYPLDCINGNKGTNSSGVNRVPVCKDVTVRYANLVLFE